MGTSVFPGGSTETWNDLSVLTTRGDLVYGSSGSPKGTRLAVGSASDVLSVTGDGLDVEWAAAGGGGFSEFVLAYNESAISCANTTMTPILCDAEKLDSD